MFSRCTVESYSGAQPLLKALAGNDVVIHLAGRAHIIDEKERDPYAAYYEANVDQTLKLARLAAQYNVRRFIFVSSIKVNGEKTKADSPFTEKDPANPVDPYGMSKYQAELGLQRIAAETSIEVVVIRPPLIYGPGVKGNFRILVDLLSKHIPLPLALVDDNKRSFISLENLASLLYLCTQHPEAAGRTFLASDQNDISTAELVRKLAVVMDKKARLIPIPRYLLKTGAYLARKPSIYQRLCESLVVDSSATSAILGWSPIISLDEGLRCSVMKLEK
jgi:nucleoside-diphosphate-sugar epimerase